MKYFFNHDVIMSFKRYNNCKKIVDDIVHETKGKTWNREKTEEIKRTLLLLVAVVVVSVLLFSSFTSTSSSSSSIIIFHHHPPYPSVLTLFFSFFIIIIFIIIILLLLLPLLPPLLLLLLLLLLLFLLLLLLLLFRLLALPLLQVLFFFFFGRSSAAQWYSVGLVTLKSLAGTQLDLLGFRESSSDQDTSNLVLVSPRKDINNATEMIFKSGVKHQSTNLLMIFLSLKPFQNNEF